MSFSPGCFAAIVATSFGAIRHEEPHRQAGTLRGGPEPVHRSVHHPVLFARLEERETQAQHAGLISPGVDEAAILGLAHVEEAEHAEPVRMLPGRSIATSLALGSQLGG